MMLTKLVLSTRGFRYWVDSILYHLRYRHGNKRLEVLKNRYRGRPILVVGNGPSLNKTPLDDFRKVFSIGMNKIFLLFPRVKWRPNIILCINNLVIQQSWPDLLKSGIPTFLSWKGRWFIDRSSRKSFNYFLSLPSSDFSSNPLDGVGSAGTVTYAALQFAYFMGANPIILFGIDHSFNCSGTANEIVKMEGPDPNHFDPNYFADGQNWGLPNYQTSELAYRNAKAAFEADNRKIYDATIGGKLDIFPKISVNEARQICNV